MLVVFNFAVAPIAATGFLGPHLAADSLGLKAKLFFILYPYSSTPLSPANGAFACFGVLPCGLNFERHAADAA
jgi:hypothetical protein